MTPFSEVEQHCWHSISSHRYGRPGSEANWAAFFWTGLDYQDPRSHSISLKYLILERKFNNTNLRHRNWCISSTAVLSLLRRYRWKQVQYINNTQYLSCLCQRQFRYPLWISLPGPRSQHTGRPPHHIVMTCAMEAIPSDDDHNGGCQRIEDTSWHRTDDTRPRAQRICRHGAASGSDSPCQTLRPV